MRLRYHSCMIPKGRFGLLRYFVRNLLTVIGIVLIWRGVWYLLDEVDLWLFGGGRIITSLGGIVLGLALLFFPDGNLKKIEKF